MKKKNVVQEKSFAFAIRIVKIYSYLQAEKKSLCYQNNCCVRGLRSVLMLKKVLVDSRKKIFYRKYPLPTKKHEKAYIGCAFCKMPTI